jgi:hypothetical protein
MEGRVIFKFTPFPAMPRIGARNPVIRESLAGDSEIFANCHQTEKNQCARRAAVIGFLCDAIRLNRSQ